MCGNFSSNFTTQGYRCRVTLRGTQHNTVEATVTTVATVCSLTGLRKGVNYAVSVMAFNQLSESPPATIDNLTMTGTGGQY